MFNLDLDSLEDQRAELPIPEVVPRRVLHIDADFLAYQVSSHSEHTLAQMQKNVVDKAQTLRVLSGAESYKLHITDANSTKGGRFEQAIQKPYQGNRSGKEKPAHLEYIKRFMVDQLGAINHTDQEADDGLCQELYRAKQSGNANLAVLYSLDKDLRMVSGLHLQDGTFDLITVDGYGSTYVDETKSAPTTGGYGTKLFWSQMLHGDTADNIQGLPVITAETANKYTGKNAKKPVKVGVKLAFDILQGAKDDFDACEIVRKLYQETANSFGFKDYRTGEDKTWYEVFMSEASLLWIRRTRSKFDFQNWIMTFITEETWNGL